MGIEKRWKKQKVEKRISDRKGDLVYKGFGGVEFTNL